MYNLKRILNELLPGGIAPQDHKALVQQALDEVETVEKQQLDTPQEMRDFFAGAAMIGILAGDPNVQDAFVVPNAWNLSDAMMVERAKRIADRKGVNPSIGAHDLAAGLRHIAKDDVFNEWPEAREELNNAADLLDSNPGKGGSNATA